MIQHAARGIERVFLRVEVGDDRGFLLSQLLFGNLDTLARGTCSRNFAHRFRRTLPRHHTRTRTGPGEQKVRLVSPAAHTVIPRTKTGANVQRDFWHPRGTDRLNHF